MLLLILFSVTASLVSASQNESLKANLSAVVAAADTTIFETDFEDYDIGTIPPGFYVQYSGQGYQYQVITTDAARSGSKSIQAWGSPGWGANIYYPVEKPEKGRIGFEVWVKANPKEEGWAQFVSTTGSYWGWGWAGVGFDSEGNINAPATAPNVYKNPQPDADNWYNVRSEVDVETGACWAWIDDELVVNGVTPADAGRDTPDAYQTIDVMGIGDSSWYESPSTPTYFDDFRLYFVPPPPPIVAEANGPYEGTEGTSIVFDASGSYGPSGSTLDYRWDFNGDGSYEADWSNNPTASYTYGDDWQGDVKLEVRDAANIDAIVSDTASVEVNNADPTAKVDSVNQPGKYFILPYDTLTFEGSFADAGWLDTHTADWDFGDGSVDLAVIDEENEEPDATGAATIEHGYIAPGAYEVTLEVADDDNGIGTAMAAVIVVPIQDVLASINNYIKGLPSSAFDKQADQRKNTLSNKINAIGKAIDGGNYKDAIDKLQNDVRAKADGSVDGKPNNDWITDQTAQKAICEMVDDLVANLEILENRE